MLTRRTLLLSLPAVAISFQAAQAQSSKFGTFTGRSRHVTKGGATLTATNLTLEKDFTLDRAPDPIVGLGKNGKWDPATFMGELAEKSGKQTYTLPANINAADYDTAIIWCRAADVPLGIAPLY
jgi:hypothetical protein